MYLSGGVQIPKILGATLFSASEVQDVTSLEDLKFKHQWWLRSRSSIKFPGDVSSSGQLYSYTDIIYVGLEAGIRPILKIDLEGTDFHIGTNFWINGQRFKILLENCALAMNLDLNEKDPIVWGEFDKDLGYPDYENSFVKKRVDDWFSFYVLPFIEYQDDPEPDESLEQEEE